MKGRLLLSLALIVSVPTFAARPKCGAEPKIVSASSVHGRLSLGANNVRLYLWAIGAKGMLGVTAGPTIDDPESMPPVRNVGLCPLAQILHETSERATELVKNLERFTATEQIEHTEFQKNGKPRRPTSERFGYVAEMKENPYGEFWVHEYRTAERQSDPPPVVENATAASALIFHPKIIGDFEVYCEGQTDLQGTPAWQLQFEERPNPSKSFSAFQINGIEYPVRLKGRAWISVDNYQLLRLQRDLVAPVPEIKLEFEHSDITYAPVEFANHRLSLWLPKIASMDIVYRGHRYRRVHSFSHFQLFLIETEEKVKEPVSPTPKSD